MNPGLIFKFLGFVKNWCGKVGWNWCARPGLQVGFKCGRKQFEGGDCAQYLILSIENKKNRVISMDVSELKINNASYSEYAGSDPKYHNNTEVGDEEYQIYNLLKSSNENNKIIKLKSFRSVDFPINVRLEEPYKDEAFYMHRFEKSFSFLMKESVYPFDWLDTKIKISMKVNGKIRFYSVKMTPVYRMVVDLLVKK